jgi:hypothetical protein
MIPERSLLGVAYGLLLSTALSVHGDILLDFTIEQTGGLHPSRLHYSGENSVSAEFEDPESGGQGSITTRKIDHRSDFILGPRDTTPFLYVGRILGISSRTDFRGYSDCDNCFNNEEAWTFDWNVDVDFTGIAFNSFGSVAGVSDPQVLIQSDTWKGLDVTSNDGRIHFDRTLGQLTLSHFGQNGPFTFKNTLPSGSLPVPSGEDITISAAGASSFGIRTMSFSLRAPASPVPDSVSSGCMVASVVPLLFLASYSLRRRY